MKQEVPKYAYGQLENVSTGDRTGASKPSPIMYGLNYHQTRDELLSRAKADSQRCSPVQQELFATFWLHKPEQDVAWSLRTLLMDQLGRPEELLMHPEEPLGIWTDSDYDSLDEVEFIVSLERIFGIEISDEVSSSWFKTWTLKDAVGYIMGAAGEHTKTATAS